MTSGVVPSVMGWILSSVVGWVLSSVVGWILGRGWPGTVAVIRLAFLRVNQDLVSVVDLMST